MKRNTLNKYRYNSNISHLPLIVFCGLLVIYSCKAKKPLVKRVAVDTPEKPVNTIASKLDAIRARQISFNTFSGRAKTTLDISGNSNDVTLNIRIARDKKIWVSVTAIAGIEVARALITPDSLMVINRLQGVYLRQPFSYIYKFASRQVNYKTIQSLLIGNAITELLNDNSLVQNVGNNTTLSGNLQDLVYKLILGPDLRATQTNLSAPNSGQSLQVSNNAFIQTANRVIPSQIEIASMVKTQKIQVNLHYTKTEFDQPLEYPFSIPSRYSPAD